ncbi:MAG: hypothetical protein IIY05_04510 [Alistipes sp.]|nr:hypothetical protein [Alistipes sp.]
MVRRFTFSLECSLDDSWRHNIDIMYVCYDKEWQKLSHGSVEDHIAPVGVNLKSAPMGMCGNRKVEILTPECEHVRLLGYVNTHSLPVIKSVSQAPPFSLKVRVVADGEIIYDKLRKVGVWGGDTIDLRF